MRIARERSPLSKLRIVLGSLIAAHVPWIRMYLAIHKLANAVRFAAVAKCSVRLKHGVVIDERILQMFPHVVALSGVEINFAMVFIFRFPSASLRSTLWV
jgi:hypothetical protein